MDLDYNIKLGHTILERKNKNTCSPSYVKPSLCVCVCISIPTVGAVTYKREQERLTLRDEEGMNAMNTHSQKGYKVICFLVLTLSRIF